MTIFNLNQDLAIISISGSDAATYLQGQLTNDIQALTPGLWQLSAHLNHKGRILASFLIYQVSAHHYYLLTAKEVATSVIPRLKMFILRSQVKLTVADDLNLYLNLNSPDLDDGIVLMLNDSSRLHITATSYDCPVAAKIWHQVLVTTPIPMIYTTTAEKIIPQQANYDLLDAISFKKGCYTGQEIVARSHYLGKIKRRLAQFSCKFQPQIGQAVVSPQLDNQEVGIIVDFYQNNDHYQGLVSLQIDCLDSAFLDQANQQPLTCTSLTKNAEE